MSAPPAAIIVIGTSTGGQAALRLLLAGLPAGFPAAILAVIHIGSNESVLPAILAPHIALPVRHAVDGERVTPGTVLIAPSDHHLLVENGTVRLSRGPKENFARPAVDPLFRSAAIAYRSKAIGVILTGNLDDGTIGLQAIKAYGGIAIVQNPAEADAPSMPASAFDHVEVDYCLPLDRITQTLVGLVENPPSNRQASDVPPSIPKESRFAIAGKLSMDELDKIGQRSIFTCPECHGILWEVHGTTPQHFRCHTGHAFTARALESQQGLIVEEALWAAVRALHEKEALLRRFAKTAADAARVEAAAEHAAAAEQAGRHAEMLRKMIGAQDDAGSRMA